MAAFMTIILRTSNPRSEKIPEKIQLFVGFLAINKMLIKYN
jgi:hypothetical protein